MKWEMICYLCLIRQGKFLDRVNTKIVGCETQYELYDLKLIYWSDGTIDHQMFNVRQKKIFNKYN